MDHARFGVLSENPLDLLTVVFQVVHRGIYRMRINFGTNPTMAHISTHLSCVIPSAFVHDDIVGGQSVCNKRPSQGFKIRANTYQVGSNDGTKFKL